MALCIYLLPYPFTNEIFEREFLDSMDQRQESLIGGEPFIVTTALIDEYPEKSIIAPRYFIQSTIDQLLTTEGCPRLRRGMLEHRIFR